MEGIYNEVFIPSDYDESLEFSNLGFEPRGLMVMHMESRGSRDTDRNILYNLYAEKDTDGFVATIANSANPPLMDLISQNAVEWGKDYVKIADTYTWYYGGYSIYFAANWKYRIIIW